MINHFVVMGVSGCGKTSIGTAFADAIGGTFLDGDDLHPAVNRAKMTAGHPLTDADRAPWLVKIGQALRRDDGTLVVGCSALKRIYRDTIRTEANRPILFLHLTGSKAVLAARMAARTGHFMPQSLLESQLLALEPPMADELALSVDIDQTPNVIVADLLRLTKALSAQ